MPSAPSSLIERAVELEVLDGAAAWRPGRRGRRPRRARGPGEDGAARARRRAGRGSGCLVRRAAPGPLERHFPFGVVRALLEAPLRDASEAERARLLDGAAAPAGTLLLEGAAPAGDSTMLVAHSVLWLCSALAERRPLALVIDDAQWADRSSLEVLSYLARRIDDLPLLIAVGARADDPRAPSDLLTCSAACARRSSCTRSALTPGGAARAHPPPRPDDAGAGVPRVPSRRRRQPVAAGRARPPDRHARPESIDAGGDDAPPVSAIARNVIRWRLATLAPRDRAVAAALAVIGDGAPAARRRRRRRGGGRRARPGARRAAGRRPARPDGERFAHGLIAAAIEEDLPGTECERLHREAARALMAGRADADVVASHLLQCGPQGDAEVSALLGGPRRPRPARGAAHRGRLPRARARGARPRRRSRRDARAAGDRWPSTRACPTRSGACSRRCARCATAQSRIDVLTRLAALNVLDAGDAGLAEIFEHELARETRPGRAAGGRGGVARRADDDPRPPPRARAARRPRSTSRGRRSAARARDPRPPRLGRHRASARPTPPTCAALALRALEGDLLLREAGRRAAYHLRARALMHDRPRREARPAIAAMRERGAASAARCGCGRAPRGTRPNLALRSGRVAEAENHARLALDLVDDDVNTFTGGAIMVLLYALAERGAFGEARELLREHRLDGALGPTRWEIGVRHARARLWLAEGEFERAHAEAVRGRRAARAAGAAQPELDAVALDRGAGPRPPRAPRGGARLADAELALAERFGAPVPIADALHARAVAEPDDAARVALCERALRCVAGAPAGSRRPPAARAGQRAGRAGPPPRGPRRAAAGAGRRRRRRRRAAGPARAARARRDRAAPAPGRDRGRRRR